MNELSEFRSFPMPVEVNEGKGKANVYANFLLYTEMHEGFFFN